MDRIELIKDKLEDLSKQLDRMKEEDNLNKKILDKLEEQEIILNKIKNALY